MRICFLEGDMSRQGGTERMTALLANALSGQHDVFVVGLRQAGETVFFSLNDSVRYTVLPEAHGKQGMLRQIRAIRRLIKTEKIDRVINVDVGMGIYGVLAARGTQAKVITWEHANYYNNWESKIFPYLRRFAARHSQAMVVLTERDRENYLTNIPRCRPVHVIPNPAESHEVVYSKESRTILSAGLLVPIKQYDKAIQVAAQVLRDRPDWKWIICGEGPERPRLEKLIRETGLSEQILLPGTERDMESRYRSSAMFVMTSRMEGLPMVLLEAKSFGLPLVSFDIMTGPSDIIADGVNGYLIPADDTSAMAEKIAGLMDDGELRERFSAESQIDMEKFSWERVMQKWSELLGKV